MRKLIVSACVATLTLAGTGSAAFAAPNPSGTGQPSVECLEGSATSEPGRAADAFASAFNESEGGAGEVYAGSGQSLNSGQEAAESQYDVACYQVSQ
jgi:hypothetical protein